MLVNASLQWQIATGRSSIAWAGVKGGSVCPAHPLDSLHLHAKYRPILPVRRARHPCHLRCMAHTYGEVLPSSFPDIFALATDPAQTVFVDAGSGYGALLIQAVQQYGFSHAVGVEKYKDKYQASLTTVAQLPQRLQERLTVQLQDINDTDLDALLDTFHYHTLLFFCNNVAFNSGTIHRYILTAWFVWIISLQVPKAVLTAD